MSELREDRIRQRAHELWEREGRPDGREAEHWRQAVSEIDDEETRAAGGGAGPAPSGVSTPLQGSGMTPGGGPGESMGSIGISGGSTSGLERKT